MIGIMSNWKKNQCEKKYEVISCNESIGYKRKYISSYLFLLTLKNYKMLEISPSNKSDLIMRSNVTLKSS